VGPCISIQNKCVGGTPELQKQHRLFIMMIYKPTQMSEILKKND